MLRHSALPRHAGALDRVREQERERHGDQRRQDRELQRVADRGAKRRRREVLREIRETDERAVLVLAARTRIVASGAVRKASSATATQHETAASGELLAPQHGRPRRGARATADRGGAHAATRASLTRARRRARGRRAARTSTADARPRTFIVERLVEREVDEHRWPPKPSTSSRPGRTCPGSRLLRHVPRSAFCRPSTGPESGSMRSSGRRYSRTCAARSRHRSTCVSSRRVPTR